MLIHPIKYSVIGGVHNEALGEQGVNQEVDDMAQNLDTWLAAMPPEIKVDERISELERELELMRTIKQLRAALPVNGDAVVAPEGAQVNGAEPTPVDLSRISPERRRIVKAILNLPGDPNAAEITQALNDRGADVSEATISANMARMTTVGLLSRVGRGRYSVPSQTAAAVKELEEREHERLDI
jgi:hypothetical protein